MKTRLATLLGFSIAATMALTACSAATGQKEGAHIESSTMRSEAQFVSTVYVESAQTAMMLEASRTLGLEMLASAPAESRVVSPASLVVALSMLGTGASGKLETQLAELLGAGGEERDEIVNALIGALAPYEADPATVDPEELPETPVVHMANQVVIDDDLQPTAAYLDNLARWYDVGILHTDLASDESKKLLDEWVRYNTAGMIEESAVAPDTSLRMVLQNATLLAARWESPFMQYMTQDGDFTKEDGTTTLSSLMHDTRTIPYAEVDGWKLVQLPYDDRLVARFVLPPAGTRLAQIDAATLADLEANLADAEVELTLPKLDIASEIDLKPLIEKLGLTAAFGGDPQAFDYIAPDAGLEVSAVSQQGRVKLDEEGTIAAVVTEVTMAASAAIPPDDLKVFTADRPHLVFLQDLETGWDLFHISVYEPTVE